MWDVETGRALSDTFGRSGPTDLDGFMVWVNAAEFVENGLRVRFTASERNIADSKVPEDEQAQLWDVCLPPNGFAPTWLSRLAKLAGGYELNQNSGIIEAVPNRTEGLRQLRKQLTNAPGKDPYVALGRWVLSDIATRTISPYADSLRQTEKSTR
jgi:hypothetical protein